MSHDSSCGCGGGQCSSCGCHEQSCSCGCGQSGNCFAGDMLDLAKGAKHKLLMEKIKQRLETRMGKELDAKADMAVELLMNKIEMKKMKKQRMQEIMSKMQDK